MSNAFDRLQQTSNPPVAVIVNLHRKLLIEKGRVARLNGYRVLNMLNEAAMMHGNKHSSLINIHKRLKIFLTSRVVAPIESVAEALGHNGVQSALQESRMDVVLNIAIARIF